MHRFTQRGVGELRKEHTSGKIVGQTEFENCENLVVRLVQKW